MNVQEQIKEWYQDRRFVNYVNMRVQEEIRHVSEQRPDQKYKELDDAFDLDDRYFVPSCRKTDRNAGVASGGCLCR